MCGAAAAAAAAVGVGVGEDAGASFLAAMIDAVESPRKNLGTIDKHKSAQLGTFCLYPIGYKNEQCVPIKFQICERD